MQAKRSAVFTELRGSLLVLLVVIPILAFAGWQVYHAVAGASRFQREIRESQVARGRVLRFQLEEETGVRGFIATGDRLYLESYEKARGWMPDALSRLHNAVTKFGVGDLGATADDERRIVELWDRTIAKPLIADPSRSPTSLELQRRGKRLTDGLQNDDQKVLRELEQAASAADARTQRALAITLFYVIAALTVISIGIGFFGVIQARTSRRAFENRVLYENQKRIADSLQTAFLNKELPLSPTVGLHATYIPASLEAQVGGDWYDAFELPDGRILFSIGDVAGHGLEAAVVMSRARQAIIAAALHEDDPAKVLERANDSILLQEPRMVTAICGYINPHTLEVAYATAGHPAPILAHREFAAEFLPHDGIPLGIMQSAKYRTFVALARDGDVMVLYTDGVIEHKRDIIAGEARLLEAARQSVLVENPALEIQHRVFGTTVPTDDVAILTVRFKISADGAKGAAAVTGLHMNRIERPIVAD